MISINLFNSSSELKLAVGAISGIVGAYLVSLGIISQEQVSPLTQNIGEVLNGIFAFAAIAGIFHSFNKGQVELKKNGILPPSPVSEPVVNVQLPAQTVGEQPVFQVAESMNQPQEVAPSASY